MSAFERLPEYEENLLVMMRKFGPAISSASVEKREETLQELVKSGYATMIRNDAGQIKYALTIEGSLYLEELDKLEEEK